MKCEKCGYEKQKIEKGFLVFLYRGEIEIRSDDYFDLLYEPCPNCSDFGSISNRKWFEKETERFNKFTRKY